MLQRLWKTASLEKVFGCDLRSLAFFRVAIAIVLLADLFNRFENFTAFHSENGLFPRSALLELYGNQYIWSLNHIALGDWWQATLLVVNVFCALCLLVGWKTRMFSVFCWILQLSLQARNPILMQSGDVLLRNLMFWGMFLPWGGKFSVDAALSAEKTPERVFSYATIGVCLQAIYVYYFAVFQKTGAPWKVDGTAVYYALNIDHFSTPLGKWMLTLPIEVLKFFNFSVLGFEFFGPILLLLPWGHKWIRPLLVLSFWGLHLGFGATLAIGNFVLISMASTIPFLPSETWDWLSVKLSRKSKSRGYYDEDCGFCVKMKNILKEFLCLPDSFFKPAQSDPKIEKMMLKEDSWVLQNEKSELFYRSDALREILKESPILFWLRGIFVIPGVSALGDFIYKKIAAGRSRTCDVNHPALTGTNPVFQLSVLENYFLAFIILFITLWNIGTLPNPLTHIAQRFEPFALFLRIEQKWDMFSPFPMTDDGWFIIKGKLRNGREVDIFRNGEPITYEKPESVKDLYKDFRWRKYMVNLWGASFSKYRRYYSKFLCREWNRSHVVADQVMSFEMIYMKENTPPPGTPLPKAEEVSIFNWNCF